jgi:hypothetical protein
VRSRRHALAALAACAGAAGSVQAVPAHAASTGYLAAPTEQLAVPGLAAGAEVTPEGDLYTGWAEYELRFGRRLRGWSQPTRMLPDPALPLLRSTLSDGPVRYTLTLFAVPVAGRPVAYETLTLQNNSASPQPAQAEMALAYTRGRQLTGPHGVSTGAYRYERPVAASGEGLFSQPGQAYSPGFLYGRRGRDLTRSGLLLARGPAAPAVPFGSVAATASPTAARDGTLFRTRLPAGARRSLTWQIPLSPPPATPAADRSLDALTPAQAEAALARLWHSEERGMMEVELPEQRVAAAYRAALVQILSSRVRLRSGWMQATNRLQYRAFWIRDAAIDSDALDLAGLHVQAAQNLGFFAAFQRRDGLFISRPGQYDGLGQALWALAEHARLSGSASFAAAALPQVERAVAWLRAATAADPLGLLPAGDPQDDELASGHLAGDDLWAAAGLRSAVRLARLAGRPELERSWSAADARFERALRAAIAVAYAREGHIPPLLDGPGGQDWGNYYASYPLQVLPAGDHAVAATLAWARAHMAEGLATYMDGASLHDYLGFTLFQTELLRGETARAAAGLYSELAHTTAALGGWEWDVAPFGSRSSPLNLAPHGTFAGDYVALVRNMLVREEEAGGVDLLPGPSPAWLAPGQRIAVRNAPAAGGTISFTERSSGSWERLSWHCRLASGTVLRWVLPPWARGINVSAGRLAGHVVELPGRSGTATATFTGNRPAVSYAGTVAALDAEYRARGRSAPIVAAVE